MKKHFIFDFDDTISSSYDFNQDMFVQTFAPYGENLDEKLIRKVHRDSRGTSMDSQFQAVIDALGINADAVQLTKENENLHLDNFTKMTLFDGVNELFDILRNRGKEISICTNRQYQSLNAIIDHKNLREYFTEIISCKDEGFEKPDPTCLTNLVEKHGGNKEEFIYFGDSKTDYEFAENAGIDFVIVDHYLNGKNFYNMIIKAFL